MPQGNFSPLLRFRVLAYSNAWAGYKPSAAFTVEDRWKVAGNVLSLSRKVNVTGAEENAGFYSDTAGDYAESWMWI